MCYVWKFQFLLVRLKAGISGLVVYMAYISIPTGTIKRIMGEKLRASYTISIPTGTIKRILI